MKSLFGSISIVIVTLLGLDCNEQASDHQPPFAPESGVPIITGIHIIDSTGIWIGTWRAPSYSYSNTSVSSPLPSGSVGGFPNPFKNLLSIRFSFPVQIVASCLIIPGIYPEQLTPAFDVIGVQPVQLAPRVLFSPRLLEAGTYRMSFEMSDLKPGPYRVILIAGKFTFWVDVICYQSENDLPRDFPSRQSFK
jgi:hypothetical protein